jgi:uncharacterized protein (TIGR00369 family)
MAMPEQLGDMGARMPFAATCGIEVVSATPEAVVGRMAWAAERCTAGGILHGGALMTLADTIGAACAVLHLPEGAGTATIASSTSFFRGVAEGHVTATARPLHTGRTTIAVRTELTDDRGRRVAEVVQTQAVLTPR